MQFEIQENVKKSLAISDLLVFLFTLQLKLRKVITKIEYFLYIIGG
tara:strand:+ start:290 stop:427 length:138 start_codon:yes stop_codon:yes gene_type:complete